MDQSVQPYEVYVPHSWKGIEQVKRQWKVDARCKQGLRHRAFDGRDGDGPVADGVSRSFRRGSFGRGLGGAAPMAELKNTPFLWVVGEKDREWASGTVRSDGQTEPVKRRARTLA